MLHTIFCGMDKDYVDRIIYTVYLDRKGPEKWVGSGEQEIIFQIDICKIRSKPGLRLLLLLNQSVKHTIDGAALMFTFKTIGETQH